VPNKGTALLLSDRERKLLRAVAETEGITEEEAAAKLVSDAIARRMRRNTGKTPAKVYPIRKH
jgi:hypothetical protein